jgi:two-component system LytT family response regulator
MKCVIIDDESEAINVLKRYVDRVPYLELLNTFQNPLLALSFLHQTKVDLIFLDINMPDMSGILLLKHIEAMPLVIFTTAYSDYAVESYEVNAVDYLLKPIAFERFIKATSKAYRQASKIPEPPGNSMRDVDFVLLKSGTQVHKVKISEILYIEKQDNYLCFHTNEKKILVRKNMADIFEILPENWFVRTHKSFIISLLHVKTIEQYEVTVSQFKIPVSEMYKDELWKKLEDFR